MRIILLIVVFITFISCTTQHSKTTPSSQTDSSSQVFSSDIEDQDSTNNHFVTPDDFPVTNEMFADRYGKISSGEVYSVDKVWFTNQELGQFLTIDLYTDYHRTLISYFEESHIPLALINKTELHLENIGLADVEIKQKAFQGFLAQAIEIPPEYFTSNQGFSIGADKQKAIDLYGEPHKKNESDSVDVYYWEFAGDNYGSFEAKDKEKPLAKGSFGYATTMIFEEEKLVGMILENDVP